MYAAVPVQKVEWVLSLPSSISDSTSPVEKYEGVTSISVPEGDVRRFVCHVNGSFPQPQVTQLCTHAYSCSLGIMMISVNRNPTLHTTVKVHGIDNRYSE